MIQTLEPVPPSADCNKKESRETKDIAGVKCRICSHATETPEKKNMHSARGNTTRFRNSFFRLWQCPECSTIQMIDPVDFDDIYSDYPLNKRELDIFARRSLNNLLKRLKSAGLKKSHTLLDIGCGNGIFLSYLREKGYHHVLGYDPYSEAYTERPVNMRFDWVIANDVIEHVKDPCEFTHECLQFMKPDGHLYVGTSDAAHIDMNNLEEYLMLLHLPFHQTIFTEEVLHQIGNRMNLKTVKAWQRSYMDTWFPFCNYRFLDELNRALDHEIDRAFDPKDVGRTIMRKPMIWIWVLLGKFFPSAFEPAIIWRKPKTADGNCT